MQCAHNVVSYRWGWIHLYWQFTTLRFLWCKRWPSHGLFLSQIQMKFGSEFKNDHIVILKIVILLIYFHTLCGLWRVSWKFWVFCIDLIGNKGSGSDPKEVDLYKTSLFPNSQLPWASRKNRWLIVLSTDWVSQAKEEIKQTNNTDFVSVNPKMVSREMQDNSTC